jgi:hypothetical protein
MIKGARVALNADDIRQLREMMTEVAAESATRVAALHQCRFRGVADEDAPQLGHALGMIADIGKGDLRGGVEELRANHQWIISARRTVERASMTIGLCVLTAIVGGLVAAVWHGVRVAVIQGKATP